jgi:hypothetical protein
MRATRCRSSRASDQSRSAVGLVRARLRDAEAFARDALVVPAACGLRTSVTAACANTSCLAAKADACLRAVHARAEEGHLEAERTPGLRLRVAGDVPPLGAQVGVAAEVARKLEPALGQRPCRHGAGRERGQQQMAPGE